MARLLALVVALLGVLPHPSGWRELSSPGPEPTDDPETLQLLQESFLEQSGTTFGDIALTMRAHLGLPAAELDEVSPMCGLATMEVDDATSPVSAPAPKQRFEDIVNQLATNGPAEIRASLAFLRSRGGRIEWAPERIDPHGWVAYQQRKNLLVGSRWLEAARTDLTTVHSSIQHEVAGHLFYGHSLSCRIVDHAVRSTDLLDSMPIFMKYGYAESEIYAELKELPYFVEGSPGDNPLNDIGSKVTDIREVFPRDVSELLLSSMTYRFSYDLTLSPEALEIWAAAVGGNCLP